MCDDVVENILLSWVLFYFYFFQYNIDTIKHQHHSSSSAINTLLLSVSFKPIFIDFAHILNMLALSIVFISSLCAVCVCRLLCVCVFSVSRLIVSGMREVCLVQMPIAEFYAE